MGIRRYLLQAKDNKLVVYLVTRYLTYFIKFLTSLLLANKLGPTDYGIWGFILLLISYFSVANFGLSNSMSVILVQNKDDENRQGEFIKNDFFLIGVLGGLIGIIMFVYYLFGEDWFERYSITYEFLIICIIAIFGHFNTNCTSICRVKNDFYRIAFNQSIVPLLLFVCTLVFDGKVLLYSLLYSTLLGNILSAIVFLYHKPFVITGKLSKDKSLHIITKGWWLFIYNLFFYLIMISTRTLISKFYSVEDFGFFSFSFTLGDAVLLLFQAVANIAFPKVLAKLGEKQSTKKNVIDYIDNTYVTIVYLAVIFVCCLFPVILLFFPKYSECCTSMSLVAITMAIYTNAYAYTSYLMTNNKEKQLVIFSLISLILNIVLAFIIIKVLELSYTYVILSTLFSYYIFYYLCAQAVKIDSGETISIVNWRLILPSMTVLLLSIFGMNDYVGIALLFFIILNWQSLKKSYSAIKTIWKDYRVINV